MGPILWQFPPNFRFQPALLEDFLALLPHDTATAAELARHHDKRPGHEHWVETDAARPLRHAIEIRHEAFIDEAFVALLRWHKVASVCSDTVDWPRLMDVTADFAYCRLHGSEQLYASGYGEKALREWREWVAAWASGREPSGVKRASPKSPAKAPRDVFVYFDNDMKVRAPADAKRLIELAQDAVATPTD